MIQPLVLIDDQRPEAGSFSLNHDIKVHDIVTFTMTFILI